MARFRYAFAAALAALVACNGIIGLSDFDKAPCPGGACTDGATPDAALESGADASDASPDVKGADPVSWAKWKMPNYDGGAVFLPNPLLYNVVDANIIEDTVTNLAWQRSTLPADATLEEAKTACAKLDPQTGPWRLPKRIELVTLIDYSRSGILIDPQFTGVKNLRVWSSSESRPLTADQAYWTVNFENGMVDVLPGTLVAKVLCVRAK